jgi:hypothetical protein
MSSWSRKQSAAVAEQTLKNSRTYVVVKWLCPAEDENPVAVVLGTNVQTAPSYIIIGHYVDVTWGKENETAVGEVLNYSGLRGEMQEFARNELEKLKSKAVLGAKAISSVAGSFGKLAVSASASPAASGASSELASPSSSAAAASGSASASASPSSGAAAESGSASMSASSESALSVSASSGRGSCVIGPDKGVCVK